MRLYGRRYPRDDGLRTQPLRRQLSSQPCAVSIAAGRTVSLRSSSEPAGAAGYAYAQAVAPHDLRVIPTRKITHRRHYRVLILKTYSKGHYATFSLVSREEPITVTTRQLNFALRQTGQEVRIGSVS